MAAPINPAQGESHPRATLSAEDIRQIYDLTATHTHREIADRYGVNQSTISRIVKGQRRKAEQAEDMTATLARIPKPTREALIKMCGFSLDHQAAELGLSRYQVKRYRSALIAAGQLEPRKPRVRIFPPEQVAHVRRLASYGYSHVGIAQIVELSETQVKRLCDRHGITTGVGFWSMSDLEQIMGVSRWAVAVWQKQEWITPQPAKDTSNRKRRSGIYHRITRREMVSFLTIRAAWPSYHPDRINDPELRQTAEMLRRNARGRWVSLREVADMACVEVTCITGRRKNGWLADWEWTGYGRGIYLWMPDGSVLPPYIERPKNAWMQKRRAA